VNNPIPSKGRTFAWFGVKKKKNGKIRIYPEYHDDFSNKFGCMLLREFNTVEEAEKFWKKLDEG